MNPHWPQLKKKQTSNCMSISQMIEILSNGINSSVYPQRKLNGNDVTNFIKSLRKLDQKQKQVQDQRKNRMNSSLSSLQQNDGKMYSSQQVTTPRIQRSREKIKANTSNDLTPRISSKQKLKSNLSFNKIQQRSASIDSKKTAILPPNSSSKAQMKTQIRKIDKKLSNLYQSLIIESQFSLQKIRQQEKQLEQLNSTVTLMVRQREKILQSYQILNKIINNSGYINSGNETFGDKILSLSKRIQKLILINGDQLNKRHLEPKNNIKIITNLEKLIQCYKQCLAIPQIPVPYIPIPQISKGQNKKIDLLQTKKMQRSYSTSNLNKSPQLKRQDSFDNKNNHSFVTDQFDVQEMGNKTTQLKVSNKLMQSIKFKSEDYKLPKDSQGIIYIKQKYDKLYYKSTKKPWFPSIKKIEIHLFNQKNSKTKNEFKNGIVITIVGDSRSECNQGSLLNKQHSMIRIQLFKNNGIIKSAQQHLNYKVIPNSQSNSTRAAKLLLQKKFWVKISAALNEVSFHFGDLTTSENRDIVKCQLGLKNRSDWQNQVQVFQSQNSQRIQMSENQYDYTNFCDLDTFNFIFQLEDKGTFQYQILSKYGEVHQDTYMKFIKQYFHISTLELSKILLGPIFSQNPSVLDNHANMHFLDNQIRVLYEYLKDLSVSVLPKFVPRPNNSINLNEYYGWRNLREAIDSSIKREPGYLCYEIDGRKYEQPVGILNMVMRFKSTPLSDPDMKNAFKWTEFKWNNQNVRESMEEIYKNRRCYVRFQLTEKEGVSPGGMAVLEIWPPYCCSPIHNHGDAYGLIKVLANQIYVQNFRDLSFVQEDQVPYMTNVYQEGEYTWMSGLSYGIHRLINPTSHTAINLQAYLNGKDSKEHFKIIKDKNITQPQLKPPSSSQKQYAEYSPQNDWNSFFNLPNIVKQKGLDMKNYKEFALLVEYVEKMKQHYGMQDSSFQWFAMTIKKEYEFFEFISKDIEKIKKLRWKPF